ncbi:MAG: Alcohol dehydrogenase GroES domain protein [Gammaproteobacteria bacterium]|jgi:L-iditol 2-dehydrogenase|nr:Alcohol dehydrogenase GroES domain protein [Gammaproteobacteria bacterium]
MKAVMLVADQVMEVQEIPLQPLTAGTCRIRVVNVGVCSSDIQRSFAGGAYFYPLVIGHEIAGEVIEVAAQVKKVKPGDRVVVFPLLPCFNCESCAAESYVQCHRYGYYGSRQHGGFADYIDVNEWNLLPLPENVSFSDAAAIEPMSVVVHALKKAGLFVNPPRQASIAIIGAGFLGLLMAQILQIKAPDCEVSIFDRNSFKLDIAKKYAKLTYQLSQQEDWKTFLDERGRSAYPIVIEATGAPSTFTYSLDLAKPNGKVIWLGNITDDLTLPKKLVSSILRKELTILGTWNSDYHPDKQDDWKDTLKLIQESVHPSDLVTHWVRLSEIPALLKKLYDHKKGVERFDIIKAMVQSDTKEIA